MKRLLRSFTCFFNVNRSANHQQRHAVHKQFEKIHVFTCARLTTYRHHGSHRVKVEQTRPALLKSAKVTWGTAAGCASTVANLVYVTSWTCSSYQPNIGWRINTSNSCRKRCPCLWAGEVRSPLLYRRFTSNTCRLSSHSRMVLRLKYSKRLFYRTHSFQVSICRL